MNGKLSGRMDFFMSHKKVSLRSIVWTRPLLLSRVYPISTYPAVSTNQLLNLYSPSIR